MPSNRYSGDVFGKKIADSTKNDGDIAGHYPYSQERWRFYEDTIDDANRIFLEYTEDARYQHLAFGTGVSNGGSYDVHTISPNAGDTLIFKTAERFRYVVGYESVATWAFSISQNLKDGDEIIIGPNDLNDGYACRFNSTLGPEKCELFILRDGQEVNNTEFNLSTPITEFQRCEWRYAWYNIMGCLLSQSYNFDNFQIGSVRSDDDKRGPSIGNFPITAKITAGPQTDNLQFIAGSAAWQTKGRVETITRSKTFAKLGLSKTATTNWEPVLAIRKDPKRSFIQTEFDSMELQEFTGNSDCFLLALVMSPQNVRDSGGNLLGDSDFSVPPELSETNSIIETTEAIDQFVDNTGTLQTSTANPGGYQIGYSALYTTGGSGQNAKQTQRVLKRKVYNGDYIVILTRTRTATSGDLSIEITMEQDW